MNSDLGRALGSGAPAPAAPPAAAAARWTRSTAGRGGSCTSCDPRAYNIRTILNNSNKLTAPYYRHSNKTQI